MSDPNTIPPVQELPLDSIASIEVDADRLNLVFETDGTLGNIIQLHAEPADNAPVITRSGSRARITQSGTYGADSTPVIRLPAGKLPGIAVNLDRGDLSFEFNDVEADLAVNVDRGNARITGSSGSTVINVDRGNIQITDRTGDLACNVDRGSLMLSGISGNIAVNMDVGNATITGCQGTLNLNVDKGDVTILRPLEQAIRLSAGNGNVAVRQGSVRSLAVNVGRGNIQSRTQLLPGTPNDDDLNLDEDIDDGIVDEALTDAGAGGETVRFNLGSMVFEAGEEGVRIARGDNEVFRASPEGVEIRGRDGKPIFAASERGVSYRGREIATSGQRYLFNTDRGNVHVDIPDTIAARVELIVNRGEAVSDIPLVEVNRPGPRGSTRRFVGVSDSTDPNRILVRASTGRGDVEIRRRPLAPPMPPSPPPPPGHSAGSRDARRRAVLDALSKGRVSIEEARTLIAAIERET